ncbi:MAG: LptF/LptG family permease, partial [Candidatus Binatia bacterium]
VIKTGALLMLAVIVLEEFVAPPLDQLALTQRSLAISQKGNLRTEHGFWSRDGLRFINVHQVLHGRIPADIDIYQFDEQGHLRVFTHARQANTEDPTQWLLTDVEQKVIDGQDVTAQSLSSLPWKSFLGPDQIGILVLPSETLSLSDLYQFVRYLREREQSTNQYELALWQMVSMPVATGAMVMMSISFVFGPLRSATAGKRIMVGSIVGVAFHLASQIFGHFGVLYALNPALTTLAPPAAILGIALWLFRRVP